MKIVAIVFAVFITSSACADGIPRTASGKPLIEGYYDSGTLTPVDRPKEFGEEKFMTRERADEIAARVAERKSRALDVSDPEREAPQLGGQDGPNTGGGGGTGGYNSFWIENGTDVVEIDGKFRTSIVYDPKNGRRPSMTPKGEEKMAENFTSFSYVNDGTASWLDKEGPGPFDGPENLALAERCLLGFSAGPPMLPGLYNNFKRITQTEDHIIILLEMVHDARVIRMNAEHASKDMRWWLGDSVGHWEGDTLVVDTTNFREQTGLYGGDENLHLVERFTRQADGNLLYQFTVDDPTIWTAPWSGEYSWKASDKIVYEYACHEGNYAMGNILRGARLLEREAAEQLGKSEGGE